MAQISARVLKVGGRPARVWRGGSGPALLLLHGGLGDAQLHWEPVWESLAHSFTVAAPDLPGFGESAPLPDASFGALRDWVGDVREALGFPRIVLVGNSFGGAIARLFAAAQPVRVIRLVLVDGGMLPTSAGWMRWLLKLPGISSWVMDLSRRLTFSRWGLKQLAADPRLITPGFVARSQASSSGFVKAMQQAALADLPQPQTPVCTTLVIWGEADRLASLARGRALARSIPGAAFRGIPGAGHLPQLERPGQFVDVVREFASQR